MSENTTPSADPNAALLAGTVAMVNQDIAKANVLAERIATAGNATVLLHQFRDEAPTEDPEVLKYREAINQINLKVLDFQSKIEAYILEKGYVDTTPIDVDAAKAEYKELAATVKATLGLAKVLTKGAEPEGVLELKAIPGTRSKSSDGATVYRPRIAVITVDGVNVEKVSKDDKGNDVSTVSFSVLAAYLKDKTGVRVEVKDLHAAAFAAAGTTDISSLNGAPFSFVYNVEKNDAEKSVVAFNITMTPEVSK